MSNGVLSEKVAIVTGAGSPIGLGLAMSEALVEAGARVAMLDIDERELSASSGRLQKRFGEDVVRPWVLDVSDHVAVGKVVEDVVAQFGGLNVLVNNAGIGPGASGQFWELPVEVWGRVVSVNYLGPVYMARSCIPHMLEQGSGSIIGVTTSLNTMWAKAHTVYGASKAAHEAFMTSAAFNLEEVGIRANVLVPGGVANTNLIRGFGGDRSTLIQPEAMKAPVVFLASDQAAGITGKRFMANLWDETLPVDERVRAAGAPAAWQPLGRRSKWEGD